jgi:hypothetical protein
MVFGKSRRMKNMYTVLASALPAQAAIFGSMVIPLRLVSYKTKLTFSARQTTIKKARKYNMGRDCK